MHDLSRCGYTDDGHAPSSQGAPGRLPGRPAACRPKPHIYSFLLVRVPRRVPRVYWPLVLGLRQAQRGRPTPLDVGAVSCRRRSRQFRWSAAGAPSWHLSLVRERDDRERCDRERWSLPRHPPPSAGLPSRTASTQRIDVSASAAVEPAGDQRHAVTDPSDEGDGAAALHGARQSRRRPFG